MRGMARGLSGTLVALVVTSVAAAGCAIFSDRVAGCVSPSNETQLLDAYAAEKALAVSPAGSSRREEPQRRPACHRMGEHVSITVVDVRYDLSADVSRDEVQTLYTPVASQAGWTPMPVSADQKTVRYCRTVLGEPSVLEVGWDDAKTLQSDGKVERDPAWIGIVVRTAQDEGAEQAAERKAAGCLR
jgi:hypothetical protein